jgi:hypothetical protein
LSGRVTDQAGAVVAGAALSLVRKNGAESRSVTNSQGAYSLAALAPGGYTLRVEVPGFAPYENDQIEVHAGGRHKLDITLQATIEKQKVTVNSIDSSLATESDRTAGAVVVKGSDLNALSNTPTLPSPILSHWHPCG